MKKYVCPCGYVYDPEIGDPDNGIAPGTAWENVPEDWVCPVCGLSKDAFAEEQDKKQKQIIRRICYEKIIEFIVSNGICFCLCGM